MAIAHMLNFAPKTAQLGHDASEIEAQNLIMGYSVEHAEIARYEALAAVAAMAGDLQTERLAREIQQEERAAAEKIWQLLGPCAQSHTSTSLRQLKVRALWDSNASGAPHLRQAQEWGTGY